MIIDETIEQLRTYCSFFGGRVAGAADFRLGLENYNTAMPLPAAYVIPLGQSSDGNDAMTGLYQFVRRTVGIVVELDARADRRGQQPAMSYDAIEVALFSTLLNWHPGTCLTRNNQGYWLEGGHLLDLDRARLFYQWEFALDTILDDTDGWNIPVHEGEDLTSIELDLFQVPPQDMTVDQPAVIVKIPKVAGTGAGQSQWDVDPQLGAQTAWDSGDSEWDRI